MNDTKFTGMIESGIGQAKQSWSWTDDLICLWTGWANIVPGTVNVHFDVDEWKRFAWRRSAGHLIEKSDGRRRYLCYLWKCRINACEAVIGSSAHEVHQTIELRAPLRLQFVADGQQVEIDLEY